MKSLQEKRIYLFARVSLICIFLVVIAGSVVRMTGSGMGCPDWPKCFGYLIPPSDVSTLTYTAGRSFAKDQMIIYNDTLWVSNGDMVAGETFDRRQWHKYPKHDYAVFNAAHTWTEYVNRLCTAVLALPTVILFILCTLYSLKTKKWTAFLLSGGVMFSIGYVAWLGKLVVDGNLSHGKVTFHMIGSMMIIAFIVALIYWLRKEMVQAIPPRVKWIAAFVLMLSVVQILLGTQVREEMDELAKNVDDRNMWIAMLPTVFTIHRSFSMVVVLTVAWLYYISIKLPQRLSWIRWLGIVVVVEVLGGIILAYAGVPKAFQPVHLFFGLVMFAIGFYGMLTSSKRIS